MNTLLNNKNSIFSFIAVLFLLLLIHPVFAAAPTHGTPTINTTWALNRTVENITAYNVTTADAEGDPVKNVYNWYRNNTPIAVVNYMFESNGESGPDPNTNITDYSGNGNSGTANGDATWINNTLFDEPTINYSGGGAFNFSGTGSISINANPSITTALNNSFSIVAWIRPRSNTVTNKRWPIVGFSGGINARNFEFFLERGTSPSTTFLRLQVSNGTNSSNLSSGLTVSLADWNFVAVVYEKGKAPYFRVNDNEANASSAGINLSMDAEKNMFIGANSTGPNFRNGFNGTIDDLVIYNMSLTPEQIYAIYIYNHTIIDASITERNETWNASITPVDGNGTGNGTQKFTVSVRINTLPTQGAPILNSSTNTTAQNITVFNVSTSDSESDKVKNIINWYLNNISIMLLNSPFEITHEDPNQNTTDYSGYNTVYNLSRLEFKPFDGFDGKGAYFFNGSLDSLIEVENEARFNWSNQNHSISVWFWSNKTLPSSPSGGRHLVWRMQNTSAQGTGYRLSFMSDNTLEYAEKTNLSSTSRIFLQSNEVIATEYNDSQWHHVAISVQISNGSASLYIDGALVVNSENNGASFITPDFNKSLYIGNDNDTGNEWRGFIDDVTLFNVTVTADQVRAIYNNRTNIMTASMLADNQTWNASITLHDGKENGTTRYPTTALTIGNVTAPPLPPPPAEETSPGAGGGVSAGAGEEVSLAIPSSGGGGAGSSRRDTYGLIVGDSLTVLIDGEQHTITITEVHENSVIVTIKSTAQSIEIEKGAIVEIDLNNDGRADMAITLDAVNELRKIMITVEDLTQEEGEEAEESYEEEKEQVDPLKRITGAVVGFDTAKIEEVSKEVRETTTAVVKYVLLANIIAGILVGSMVAAREIKRRRIYNVFHQPTRQEFVDQELNKLRQHAIAAIKEGSTIYDIKSDLLDAGWFEYEVDEALVDIMLKEKAGINQMR